MLKRLFRFSSCFRTRRDAAAGGAGSEGTAQSATSRSRCRTAGRQNLALAVQLALCTCLAVLLATAAGCRDTDALKEILYDQNASLTDYDNPLKFYINDSSADEESDAVSSLEVSDEDPETDQIQNLVIYSSEPNSEGFTAKRSVFSPFFDFSGIEASESVFFYQSDSVDALDHEVTPTPEEESEEAETEPEESQSSSSESSEGATGTDAGSSIADPEASDDGGTTGNEDNPIEYTDGTDGFTSTEGVGEYKSFTLAFDISNPDADIPQVESIAAFGQYALIVQMIGGSGALAATDATTLSLLNEYGVDTTAVSAWSDDSGDASSLINVRAIVESGAQVIVVEDPKAYTAQLSYERFNYLEENGIQWISLRDLSTSVNIKANVEVVGEMLQGSSVAAYGETAQERAQYYIDFHDRVVSSANNGLAYDTVNGALALQNENASDGLGYSSNTATYTVLVDAWDAGAYYSSGGLTFDAGVAYASAGYSTTPVSYYMQAGGTINNAAALKTASSSGEVPVLQFSGTEFWNANMWWNTSLSNILYGVESLLDSGVGRENTGSTLLGQGLGSDAMPKLIVTSSSIKDAILASSASETSLYHAYPYTGTDMIYGALGITYTTEYGSTSLWSCIGSNATSSTVGDPNPLYPNGSIDADDILVNPSGYFCDWTEGTVESFLEAGWIGAYVNGSYSQSQWEQDVKDFYSWAWGIAVEMNTITNR